MILSLLRMIGSFTYSLLISWLFLWVVKISLRLVVLAVSGFWMTLLVTMSVCIWLAWLSEKGLQVCSIPYNWLWDRSTKTRLATTIAALLGGVACVSVPFYIPGTFSVGDWFVTVICMVISLFFYFNLCTLPFLNADIGARN